MSFSRRDFAGGAVSTTLVGSINALSTSWQIADATGWPLGTNGPFLAVFNRLGPGPTEKVLCTSLSGSTIQLAGTSDRGVDGTTAQAWAAPTSFEHCSGAIDADEANLTVSELIGQVQQKGDVLTGKSVNRLQRTPIGSNDALWVCDSSQPGGFRFGSLPVGAINSAAQIVDATIPVGKLIWGPYGRLSLVGQTPTVPTGVTTVLGFQTVDYDDNGLFTDSQTFTCPAGYAGLWHFDACLAWPATTDGATRRDVSLRAGGTIFAGESKMSIPTAGMGTSNAVAASYRLGVGGTVQVLARQDSAGTLQFASSASTHFAAHFVRPT